MKKITSFVLAATVALSSTTAFAGGTNDVIIEPVPAPVVVDGGSSSALPWWAVAAGVIGVGVLLSDSK